MASVVVLWFYTLKVWKTATSSCSGPSTHWKTYQTEVVHSNFEFVVYGNVVLYSSRQRRLEFVEHSVQFVKDSAENSLFNTWTCSLGSNKRLRETSRDISY